jgi:ubiquinone/menaquinone biosynthesis C-methylase UbiE
MSLWHAIGRQLKHPTGFAGRLAGNAMLIANRRPNVLAIQGLEIGPYDDILELGFGPGHAIELMTALAPFGRIWGIDQSSIMFEQAWKRNARAIRAGRVHLRHGRFDELPLPAASVDKILAVNVIYFWMDPVKVLKEVERVLRPGGVISIYATHASAMRRWKFADPETHRLYDAEALAAVARHAGFGPGAIEVSAMRAALGVPGLTARIMKH